MKPLISTLIAVLFIFILSSYHSFAATIHVPSDQPTIQAGIDAASSGDMVLVAPGVYVEIIEFPGWAITLKSEAGAESTSIDGHQSGFPVVTFPPDGIDSPIIDGFTIRNGKGYVYGGGIYCSEASPEIINCTITENLGYNGGGIHSSYSSPMIRNCRISANTTKPPGGFWKNGGGIYCINSSPTISNCEITGNDAKLGGGIYFRSSSGMIENCAINRNIEGGLYLSKSSPVISDCIISNNRTYAPGGGISCGGFSFPTIKNCTIFNNISEQSGGGIHFHVDGSPTILHCTISGNSAYSGGGIACYDGSLTITNCILWGNSATQVWPEIHYSLTPPVVTYSDVQGGWSGTGNIDADPLFIGGGDYHLSEGSPCIDTGTDAGVYADIDGEVRPYDTGFDMGADEYVSCFDDDEDGYYDEACGGDDCDDIDPEVNPGANEICDNEIDDDCDGLVDYDDPDCVAEFILELDASYELGRLNLDFALGTAAPSTWDNYLLLIYPTLQIIPLWTVPLPVIYPSIEIPISFPFPTIGWIGIWSAISIEEGTQAVDLVWIDTGW